MVKPLWKILSLMMSLATFGVVAALSVTGGDDMPWTVVRGVISLIVCWIILSNLGSILAFVLPNPNDSFEVPEEDTGKKKKKG